MTIHGIENMSGADINYEIEKGGKFVIYTYAISILILTFKRSSDVYFLKCGDYAVVKGWPYQMISLALGWWGFPWGPIYTLQSFYYGFVGKDVTSNVLAALIQHQQTKNIDATYSQVDQIGKK